jgi:hypothetical protein
MPSLLKYFAIVGSALVALLMLAHSILDTGTATQLVAAAPKKPVIEHDPRASVIERWRNEQAAMKAQKEGKPIPQFVAPAEPIVAAAAPATTIVTPTVAPPPVTEQPAQVSAPAALTTAPAAAPVVAADAEAEAEALKAEKAKAAKAEKLRKARIARAKARELAERQANPYERAPIIGGYRVVEAPYAYAPQRPAFDLFGRQRTW